MQPLIKFNRKLIAIVVAVALLTRIAAPAIAESPVKMKKFAGTIHPRADGVAEFSLDGNASHLGEFACQGEVEFVPGDQEGSLLGEGVAVFKAANGDLLVGKVTWDVEPGGDARTSSIAFHWQDAVEFSDGTIVTNTGHFVSSRPPGLVVIAIVDLLLRLLYPSHPR